MSNNVKQVSKTSEVDERMAALAANAAAISALASAVEGTIGPKGLDCMLVDKFGDVTVTNDGATILDKIDTAHPAARMLIKAARAQEQEIGDGTTTTAILASVLIAEGAAHVSRGVPVTKVIEGIRLGIKEALAFIESQSKPVESLDDAMLISVARVAARGHEDISELMVQAARLTGQQRLLEPGFALADAVLAKESAPNEVFAGIILDKQRLSRQMPKAVENARTLIVDDALEPPQIEDDALGTESGFARHMALREEFKADVQKLIGLGVRFIAVAKGVDPIAEELLTDAGVFAVRRISSKDISKLVELTGARTIKRSGLRKDAAELEGFLGHCDRVYEDERLDHIRVENRGANSIATVLVGASTREVKDERERMARDAAGAVQTAVRTGVVAGGGAVEIAAARQVQELKSTVRGMASYGVDAVAAALRRLLGQIVANAGFNPLEKVEDVAVAQVESGKPVLGVDCDSGETVDMIERGVLDPTGVKLYALRAATEVAEAVLRINTVIRKREEPPQMPAASQQQGDG